MVIWRSVETRELGKYYLVHFFCLFILFIWLNILWWDWHLLLSRVWPRVPGVWQPPAVWLHPPVDPHLPHRGRHEGRHLLTPGPGGPQRVPGVGQQGAVPLSLHRPLLLSLQVLRLPGLRLQDGLPGDVHVSPWRGQSHSKGPFHIIEEGCHS